MNRGRCPESDWAAVRQHHLSISQAYENRTNSLLEYFRDTRDSAFISEFIPGDEANARRVLNMRWWQAYRILAEADLSTVRLILAD